MLDDNVVILNVCVFKGLGKNLVRNMDRSSIHLAGTYGGSKGQPS